MATLESSTRKMETTADVSLYRHHLSIRHRGCVLGHHADRAKEPLSHVSFEAPAPLGMHLPEVRKGFVMKHLITFTLDPVKQFLEALWLWHQSHPGQCIHLAVTHSTFLILCFPS